MKQALVGALALAALLATMLPADAEVVLRCRSSVTGKFVSINYAKANPETTWCKFKRQ